MLRASLCFSAICLVAACANTPEDLPVYDISEVRARAETDPMTGLGDRADDPAIWVNSAAPEQSLILGTNKEEGLHVYDLSGSERQFLNVGRINNVDIRGRIGVASNDQTGALSWFLITGTARPTVSHIGDTPVDKVEPYGVCLGEDSKGLIAAATYKDGAVQLWRADLSNETGVTTSLERTVKLKSQLEGCVFDETQNLLFIGEEAFGIWAVDYRNTQSQPFVIDRISDGNGLVEDTEGLSIWRGEGKNGYLVASAQAENRYVVYDRAPPFAPRGVFMVISSEDATIDGVSHTDGLDVVSSPLPGYPGGLLVVQDDANPESEVDQNFKLVSWNDISEALLLNTSQ